MHADFFICKVGQMFVFFFFTSIRIHNAIYMVVFHVEKFSLRNFKRFKSFFKLAQEILKINLKNVKIILWLWETHQAASFRWSYIPLQIATLLFANYVQTVFYDFLSFQTDRSNLLFFFSTFNEVRISVSQNLFVFAR